MIDTLLAFIFRLPTWLWIALIVLNVVLGVVAYLILLERKVASWVQDRIGPNRAGPKGLLQPMADGLKMFTKEDYRSSQTDPILFTLAPILMICLVLISIAVIPWGGWVQKTITSANAPPPIPVNAVIVGATEVGAAGQQITYRWPVQIANLNIGALYILAVLSLAVYGVVLAGYSSNNKFSFMGGLRATAQMVSYEIPLGLSLLTIVLMFGTLDLSVIVEKQVHYWGGWVPAWNVFAQPAAFLLFLVCLHAEANRAPFDLAEAEQELVGGYHTEYTSMRLGFLLMGEYVGMVTTSALCVALFFGGWHIPWLDKIPAIGGYIDASNPSLTGSLAVAVLRAGCYFAKVMVLIFVFMWVRWTLPRFRFDQLMMLAWRGLIPMSLGLMMATATVIYYFGDLSQRAYFRIGGRLAAVLLATNVLVVLASMGISVLLPAPPPTNRRVRIIGSRYQPAR